MKLFAPKGYVLLVILLSVFLACGKKGGPKPPEAMAPAAVQFLEARAEVDAVILSWIAPEVNASGDDLLDLKEFVVKRAVVETGETPKQEIIARIPEFQSEEILREPYRYVFRDSEVEPGTRYQYVVLGVNDSRVQGRPEQMVVVTFIGENSVIELR